MMGPQPGKDGFPPGFEAWSPVPCPGLSLLIWKVGETLPALNENGQAQSGSPDGSEKDPGTQDAIMLEWICRVWDVLPGEAQKMVGHARLGVLWAMPLTRGRGRFRGFSRRKATNTRAKHLPNTRALTQPQRDCSRECLCAPSCQSNWLSRRGGLKVVLGLVIRLS